MGMISIGCLRLIDFTKIQIIFDFEINLFRKDSITTVLLQCFVVFLIGLQLADEFRQRVVDKIFRKDLVLRAH